MLNLRQTGLFIYAPGKKGSKMAKSMRSYTVRGGGKYPDNNLCQILPKALKDTRVDNLVIQAPANDKTNLGDMENLTSEEAKTKVSEYSKVLAYLANRATQEYPQLKRVIVMGRAPRADVLENKSKLANLVLQDEIKKLDNDKVRYFEHTIANQGYNKDQVFGVKGGRNDGVHLNGEYGVRSYMDSIAKAFSSNGESRKRQGN